MLGRGHYFPVLPANHSRQNFKVDNHSLPMYNNPLGTTLIEIKNNTTMSTIDLKELAKRESERVEWKENVADIDITDPHISRAKKSIITSMPCQGPD